MNDRTLLALALAKTLYSEKRNYLDTFAPFILKGLEKGVFKSIQDLESFLEEKYSLSIPLNTIQSILKKLEREDFLRVKGHGTNNLAAIPKEKGTEHLGKAEEGADKIARKQTKLINKLKKHFCKELNRDFSVEEVADILKKYILENISYLALQNGQSSYNTFIKNTQSEKEKSITRFLITVFDQEQELYESFNDLLRGAVLWQSIANKESLDNEGVIDQLTIYLDTNIILSLLGLHHDSLNRAAKQLLQLLKNDDKIYLRVFDKTLDEVINLLAAYKYTKDYYGAQRVNHVYFFLKKKGFDSADIDVFIDKLEDKLEELEIYKEELGIEDSSDLPKREKKLYEELYSEKKDRESEKEDYQRSEKAIHRSTLHDVAILSKIRSLRNGWQSSFERCKALFLTNSYRLYSFSKRNKLKRQAIPEVLTDITLTNILWLKNPGSDVGITIDNLLYVHSSEFLVDNKIWRKFIRVLKQVHEDGDIDKGDYALLMSKNQLTDEYLLSKSHEEITPESVKGLTDKIKEKSVLKDAALNVKDKKIGNLEEKNETSFQKLKNERSKNENISEKFQNLKDDYNTLEERFRSSEIERECKKQTKNLAKKIKRKTYWGILIATIALGIIFSLLKILQIVPDTKPGFEFIASISIDILLVIVPMSIYAVKKSNWSFKDGWCAFFYKEKLYKNHYEELRELAENNYKERLSS